MRLAELVESERLRAGVPGCAVVVVRDGETLLSEGFGTRDVDAHLPVTTQTLFQVGSATKTFTAALLVLLAQEGVLDLDAPLSSYLPGFAMHDPVATAQLSLRDCLTHRSGLPRHDLVWQAGEGVLSRDDVVAALAHLPANKGFREEYQYNNLLYLTAGHVAAGLAGGPYEHVLRERLLGAMPRTHHSVAGCQADADHATPYVRDGDVVKEIPFASLDLAGPAGSLITCADDLVPWLLALTGRGPLGSGALVQLRTPEIAMPPKEPAGPFDVLGYGLGLMVERYRGRLVTHHGGNIDGFSAQVLTRDDGVGIAVLTNLHTSWLRDALPYAVLDRLDGVEGPDHGAFFEARLTKLLAGAAAERAAPLEPASAGVLPLPWHQGVFRHPAYGDVTVEVRDGGLWWGNRALRDGRLHHVRDRDFAATAWLFGGEQAMQARFDGDDLLLQVEPMLPPLRFARV
jgi:CubicO group peptidase (beta-lactamase class C family)